MKALRSSLILLTLLFVVVGVAFSAGNKKTVATKAGQAVSSITASYANSYVDTVIYNREPGISALAFGTYWADSACVIKGKMERWVNGKTAAMVAGDTLTTFANDTSAAVHSKLWTVPVAPLADQYVIIITYGATLNGVTTPTATYEFIKQYAK